MGDLKSYRWQQVRLKVLERDGWICWLCGLPIDRGAPPRSRWSASVDHIVPRSKGGNLLDPANLRAAHHGHNSARGNREPKRQRQSRAW